VIQSIVLNLVQLAFVLALSPLFAGVLNRCKEIVQSKQGPSIFQRAVRIVVAAQSRSAA
jgi:formate hydrogenlyase subunit 4